MVLTWWDATPRPTLWCCDALCGDYLLGISDGRPWPRLNPSRGRGILTACIIFHFDDHLQDQAGNELLRNSEISSSICSIGCRDIVLFNHRSCFPVSTIRLNRASIQDPTSIARSRSTRRVSHRVKSIGLFGNDTLTFRCLGTAFLL
jgi:hypothetical protein